MNTIMPDTQLPKYNDHEVAIIFNFFPPKLTPPPKQGRIPIRYEYYNTSFTCRYFTSDALGCTILVTSQFNCI